MRDIAKLLFGEDAVELLDIFGGPGRGGPGRDGPGRDDRGRDDRGGYRRGGYDRDGFGLAERARRSGEWCGSTPGRGSVADALHD